MEIKDYRYSFSRILDICLYKHVLGKKLMDTNITSLVIALAIASMALTPLIMIQNVDAASFSCAAQTEKSHAWIQGCKDGWFDHDHCIGYTTYSGDYGKGYKVGWSHGSC